MRRVNCCRPLVRALSFAPASRSIEDSRLKSFIRNKVSNLKMDIDETEIPFGVGVSARGVEPDTENPFDTGAVNPGYDETGENE